MSGFLLQPIRPDKYVETSVSRKIKAAVAFAAKRRKAVIIRGPAGIGKSSALADVVRNDFNARAFEIPQNGRTIKRVLEGVAGSFNIRHSRAYAADLAEVLSHWLPGIADDGLFLIVDEVQNVGLDGVRQLLTFNEHYGLPLVLAGNPAAIRRTHANTAVFDQVDDRVAQWVELDSPAAADIRLIAIEHGLEGIEAYRLVERFGSQTTIRKTVKLLEAARDLVGPEGSIRLDHIRAAAEFMHEGNRQLLQVLRA